MAKDPAFLFYSQDFQTGTQFFTDEQVGKYIRLLIAQHQHGHLSEKQILHICKVIDPEIMEKFEKDPQGLFFNARLDQEAEKRRRFCDKQKSTVATRWKNQKDTTVLPKTYHGNTTVLPLENENEIENEDENKTIIENVLKAEKPKKQKKPDPVITYPWDSEVFKDTWQRWKTYKKEQFKFSYKPTGEQAALMSLAEDSGGDEREAIKMIIYAIGRQWAGIYKTDKTNGNGTKREFATPAAAAEYDSLFAAQYGKGEPGSN